MLRIGFSLRRGAILTRPAHRGKVKRSTVPTKAELLADRERHSKAMLDLVALVKRLLERINHFSHVAAQDYAREAELEMRKITRGR